MATHADGTDPTSFASPMLVLAPSLGGPDGEDYCKSLLTDGGGGDHGAVVIALNESPDQYLERWEERVDAPLPDPFAIISTTQGTDVPSRVHVETVSSAGDLTSLGMAISAVLGRMSELTDSIAACLDSLTLILQYVDTQRAFRFVHTIDKRFQSVDASVHIHLDPVTQDEQTVATFSSLANSAVRYEDGEWRDLA